MYDELVKKLRRCGKGLCTEDCPDWTNSNLYHTCQDEVVLEAADAIEELSKPRWIPVTERCPEKSGDYLVFDDCRNLYVNEWHCLLKKWQYDDSRITHWQPLPTPPKEEA